MKSGSPTGPSFRRQLADAARELRPDEPMRLLAKRTAPLVRQKEKLGTLQVLLRLTFDAAAPARGVLVFEWPSAAHGHSIVSVLERWSGRCADGASRDGSLVLSCRNVEDAADRVVGTHLKVEFEVAKLTDSMDELLSLAARVGLGEVLGGRADSVATPARTAKPATAKPATAKPVAAKRKKTPVRSTPRAQLSQPEASQPKAAQKASPPADPAQQAAIDSITHNDVFNPSTHPRVSVNDEVTTSTGVTFRLITKRVGGQRRRVWIRVASTTQQVSRAG